MPDYLARPILFEIIGRELGKAVEMPEVNRQLNLVIDGLLSPSYREMLRLDPAETIKAVKVPWLALYGENDYQVLAGNMETLVELNPKVESELLKGHNHLFQSNAT